MQDPDSRSYFRRAHRLTITKALERQSRRENPVTLVGRVNIGSGKLVANTDQCFEPPEKRDPAQNQSRRKQHLVFAMVLSVRPVGIVNFEFRPEELKNVILERYVNSERVANDSGIGKRVSLTDRELHIEVAPAFASSDGRG